MRKEEPSGESPDIKIKEIDNRNFLGNPPGELNKSGYTLRAHASVREQCVSVKWERSDSAFCTYRAPIDIKLFDGSPEFSGVPEILLTSSDATKDTGVRFLPWEENKVTFCQLDMYATLVFTGPLTGCSVYVVTVSGYRYLVHVNSNADKTPDAKDKKLREVLDDVLPGAKITHRLTVDDYRPTLDPENKDEFFAAFVFGRLIGKAWDFRYNSIKISVVPKRNAAWETTVKPFHAALPLPQV